MTPLAENISILTLLGYRFLDAATDAQVSDSLTVTARPTETNRPVVSAFRTRTGYYAFHGLPGMRDFEYADDAEATTAMSPPDAQDFIIEITDQRKRFTPVVHRVTLPLSISMSPPPASNLLDFYLTSAPTRRVAPGMAVVYAQLVDFTTQAPVQNAVLEVRVNNGAWLYGISDANGSAAVLLPYPDVSIALSGSPPSGQTSLFQQEWEMRARVRYEPAALAATSPGTGPELSAIFGQAPGRIVRNPNTAPQGNPSIGGTLRYGQPGVFQTQGASMLFIRPSSP